MVMRLVLLLFATTLLAAERKPVYPAAAAKPVGPYTPGIIAGDYLYVSGQGARDVNSKLPATFEEQTRQCLENVKAIVEAAGLKMENIVYNQVYLSDMKNFDAMNKVYAQYFPNNPPARSVAGVAHMPTSTPIEITSVAIRNLGLRKSIKLPAVRVAGAPVSVGVQVGERFYLGGVVGRDFDKNSVPAEPKAQVDLMLQRTQEIFKAAKLELRNLVSATIYVDSTLPMESLIRILNEAIPTETASTVVRIASLPFGAKIAITGVASRDLKRSGNCTATADTLYCRARSGSIGSAVAAIKADLEAARAGMQNVVASNVYIDHIDNFAAMNKVYGAAFGSMPPTRTTVQPAASAPTLSLAPATDSTAPADEGPKVQLSVIAVR